MASQATPFHDGSVESGIALAIQQKKLVACFIFSHDDRSRKWFQFFRQPVVSQAHASVSEVIATKAVLLRLAHGSTEAQFLEAFCPIAHPPVLVFIDKGQVLAKIESSSEIPLKDWMVQVGTAIGLDLAGEEIAAPSAPSQASSSQAASSSSTSTTVTASAASSARTEQLKQEQQKKQQRKKEAEEALAAHQEAKKSQTWEAERSRRDWLAQQKQRKDDAKRERERILAQIEADKLERRVRARQDKEQVEGASEMPKSSAATTSKRMPGSGASTYSHCDISVRLFDGSSIRGRFESNATLGTTVREWIQAESPPSAFTFRQILAPHPSRSITVSDEALPLSDLEMLPTANLVLVPAAASASAYPSTSILTTIIHPFKLLYLWLCALLSSLFASSAPSTPIPSASEPGAASSSRMESAPSSETSARIKVKTLADQRAEQDKRPTEFYNGNSLGFEPRKEDEDDAKRK